MRLSWRGCSRLACATAASLALLASSCGQSDRKKVYPASTRLIDSAGKPIAGAAVVLHPLDAPDDARHKPAGTSDADGRVVFTTYVQDDGAPAGRYAVTVEARPVPKSPSAPELPDRLQGKFRDPKTSKLELTVTKGTNDLPEVKLPVKWGDK